MSADLILDGSLDSTFKIVCYDTTIGLALQIDGKVLLGGFQRDLTGVTNTYIGRVPNTGSAPEILGLCGSTVTWLRGGTGPELWYAMFQHSTNEVDWTDLGPGTRIKNGWVLPGVALGTNEVLRAQGYVSLGQYNGPNWPVSSQVSIGAAQSPVIIVQPVSRTNYNGTSTSFSVLAGLEPLNYQWLKNGTNLPGATNATLLLPNITPSDAADYQVIASNDSGTETSSVASLTVNLRPTILSQGLQRGQATGYRAEVAIWPGSLLRLRGLLPSVAKQASRI